MRLLPLLVAFLFAFCVLQGLKQRAYREETIIIENDLFFKDDRNDVTVTGSWLAQNQFSLSVDSEQVSLIMNLDVSGDKGTKGYGKLNWGTTSTPKEEIKREKIHKIGTCPVVPRHTTILPVKNGTCKPRVPGFIEKVWSMALSVKKQGGLVAGKVFYGLRVIAGKGWNTGKMAGVKVLDFGAMVVGTGKSIAETTVETGNWVLGKVFDTGKFVVDMALDVGWKWSGKVIEYGLIYSRDFAVMAYKGHIEGYLMGIRDMQWGAILQSIQLITGLTLGPMIIGFVLSWLLKKLRKPPRRILPARVGPAGRRKPANTSRRTS